MNGSLAYDTPRLDALAADGLRFTQAFSTPLCWKKESPLDEAAVPGSVLDQLTQALSRFPPFPAEETPFGSPLLPGKN